MPAARGGHAMQGVGVPVQRCAWEGGKLWGGMPPPLPSSLRIPAWATAPVRLGMNCPRCSVGLGVVTVPYSQRCHRLGIPPPASQL